MLTEFIMADSFRFNGQIVRYTEVLDTLNSLIRENSLYDFILSFQYEWEKILREKTESSIRNKAAYMKVCLWDWLKRWKIEEYNQLVGLVWGGEYDWTFYCCIGFGDLQAGDFVQTLWQKKSQHPLKCYDYELLDKLEFDIM